MSAAKHLARGTPPLGRHPAHRPPLRAKKGFVLVLNPDRGLDSNWKDRRRGSRLNSRVLVAVEWEDASGKTLRDEGFTRVVNPAGCLALLPHDVPLDLRVRITNLNLPDAEPVRGTVVWKGRETPEGFEIGMEFAQSQIDFWGIMH